MTLKDIADLAGVSMMTVSNVINGKTNRVSQKTRDKVNTIIAEYGYVPNLNARSLTNKTSNMIGIIISFDRDSIADGKSYLENPYTSTMIGIMESELQKNGYYTMIRSVTSQKEVTALLNTWNVDGIIFLYPSTDENILNFAESASCPIAIFDSQLEHPNLINICSDDEKGLYLATKYMINHGHTHIAFVADYQNNILLTNRFRGYQRALLENDIPFRENYVFCYPPTYEGGIQVGKQLAFHEEIITGVVTTADVCAIGVMEGARLGGYRIPMDLSVIGYDNTSICQYTMPKLTSISQNVSRKAFLAVELLLEKIRTGTITSANHIVMDVDVVERQSVISLF